MRIEINTIDRTNQVIFGSLTKKEAIGQLVTACSFAMNKYGDRDYLPAVGDRVEIFDDDDNYIFSGSISGVTKSTIGSDVLRYDLEWLGDAYLLETRARVVERYFNTTGNAIIADLLSKYAPDFNDDFVDADFEVSSMTFNRVTLKDALQKLAKFSNYIFYVGYEKDLHFMPKFTEPAPFSLSTDSANYIYDSLSSVEDFTQIRNSVFVEGGTFMADPRTESFFGIEDQLVYPHASKFSNLPTVEVEGTPVTVGVDYLSAEDDFDCFWNYNEKYVRFKVSTAPGIGDRVDITGTPLYPLIFQVQDVSSMAALGGGTLGIREYAIKDQTIKTPDEAEQRAVAELEAYSAKITDGTFATNTPGLRTGQIISIDCPEKEISGQYIIQGIDWEMVTNTTLLYRVRYANLNTVKLLDIWIEQLRERQRDVDDREDAGILRSYFINEFLTVTDSGAERDIEVDDQELAGISEQVDNVPGGEWVFGPHLPLGPTDPKFVAVVGKSWFQ